MKFYREVTHFDFKDLIVGVFFIYIRPKGINTFIPTTTTHNNINVITSETPYKLAEIIRDTWPQLYRPARVSYNEEKQQDNEQVQQ